MQNLHHHDICPIRDIISRLSSKWAMLVLIALYTNNVMRYNEIKKDIGDISERMLSITLHDLISDGLIQKEVFPEVPPRTEYKLTPLGESLIPQIEGLVQWALKNSKDILASRANTI